MESTSRLEREICELAAHLAAATCRWLLLIAEFDRLEGWAEWGVVSCAHWLSWRCGIGPNAAREHVRVGRALEDLPLVRQAFAGGELSYSKVRALTRVATPVTEEDLVMIARHATGAQLEKLVRGYRGALRATSAQAMTAHERQRLVCEWDDDGMLRVQGRLTAENGALLLAALDAAEVVTDPEARNAERRAEALALLARGEGAPGELVMHVDLATLAGDRSADELRGGGRAELEAGPALAPETARRLACDAAVVTLVERDGEPLSVGRRTRAIPSALRRALRSRDHGGCRFPGCTHTRYLHAHHIEHWARGGATEIGNLIQLCSYHHRLVHEGGYQVARGSGGMIRFRTPDGRAIPDAPITTAATGATIRQRNRSRRLAIDHDTCRPKSAGDRLDYDLAVGGLMAARSP